MTTRELDNAHAVRAKALNALTDAVEVYKSFLTLKRAAGLVQSGQGLDAAVCFAAADFVHADKAYSKALAEYEALPPIGYTPPRTPDPDSVERSKMAKEEWSVSRPAP